MGYKDFYTEDRIIGRGNFGNFYKGIAVLCRHKVENIDYVAKKIHMSTLNDKE